MSDAVATRKDIDDVLSVLGTMVERIDKRFDAVEHRLDKAEFETGGIKTRLTNIEHEIQEQRKEIQRIFTYLDSIEKQLEVSEQERLVAGHQLERLDKWVHNLAAHIGYKLPAR